MNQSGTKGLMWGARGSFPPAAAMVVMVAVGSWSLGHVSIVGIVYVFYGINLFLAYIFMPAPTPTLCMNTPPDHPAHSGSSHPPTSDGRNLHHQHDGRSLVTLILHPHQASILYNSPDLACLRHVAHYFVMLPVRSNFIPQPLHLTSTLSSLWKIHTP